MQKRASFTLVNSTLLEAWPATLLSGKGNQHARAVAQADWILRRKSTGQFIGWLLHDEYQPMMRPYSHEFSVLRAMLQNLRTFPPDVTKLAQHLPLSDIQKRLTWLGLDVASYQESTQLSLFAEPAYLSYAGRDRYNRPLWLSAPAQSAWQAMHAAALDDAIQLDAISGYRSHDYQLGIVKRKLARGQTLDEILTVNAAPGFSEHHTGQALDISTLAKLPQRNHSKIRMLFAGSRSMLTTMDFT